MTKDDGYELLWPKGPVSKWWLVVGFAGGIIATLVLSLLMTLESLL